LLGKLLIPAHTAASIQEQLPALTKWKADDGLPERKADYDDSRWIGKLPHYNDLVFFP
jgi:hypothetical protein